MEARFFVFVTIGFLHNLFTVIWIGGMITLAAAVLPAVRKKVGRGAQLEGPQKMKLLDTIQSRLSTLAFISIAGLVATGILLSKSSPQFQGLFQAVNPYSLALMIKHILVALMIVLALGRRLVLAKPSKDQVGRQRAKLVFLLMNILIGLLVIYLSAYTTALSMKMMLS